jgi:hypothetical protein
MGIGEVLRASRAVGRSEHPLCQLKMRQRRANRGFTIVIDNGRQLGCYRATVAGHTLHYDRVKFCGTVRGGYRGRLGSGYGDESRLAGGLGLHTAVEPTIGRNDARGRSAPSLLISQTLIAVAMVAVVGCSSNSHSIAKAEAPLPEVAAASNPWTAFSSNPEVTQILASSCFDCHSEEGRAAWYVKIAPSYWFAGSARENLNFTNWKDYDAQRRKDEIEAIGRVVNRGEMPPWDYTVFHPAAELTNAQKDLVSQWAASRVETLPAH